MTHILSGFRQKTKKNTDVSEDRFSDESQNLCFLRAGCEPEFTSHQIIIGWEYVGYSITFKLKSISKPSDQGSFA